MTLYLYIINCCVSYTILHAENAIFNIYHYVFIITPLNVKVYCAKLSMSSLPPSPIKCKKRRVTNQTLSYNAVSLSKNNAGVLWGLTFATQGLFEEQYLTHTKPSTLDFYFEPSSWASYDFHSETPDFLL